jgi:hypothetical protein
MSGSLMQMKERAAQLKQTQRGQYRVSANDP